MFSKGRFERLNRLRTSGRFRNATTKAHDARQHARAEFADAGALRSPVPPAGDLSIFAALPLAVLIGRHLALLDGGPRPPQSQRSSARAATDKLAPLPCVRRLLLRPR